MRLYPALGSVMISALLAACASQLDESGAPTDLESDPQGTAGNGSSAGTGSTPGKGGSTSMAFGGSAGVGGKASGGSSSGSGGKAGAGSAGTAGSSDDGGQGGADSASAGTGGSGGTGVTSSCAGLPEWMPNAEPPNKPMLQGDELTYMGHKFAVEPANAMIVWWNDVCPPSGTRATWCETDAQRYLDLGACE